MKLLIRKLIAIFAYWLGLWRLAIYLCFLVERKPILFAFTFHRVLSDDTDVSVFFRPFEVGCPRSEYEEKIRQILRWFDVIDLARFERIVSGEEVPSSRRPLALLTYDDADADHLTEAFPILFGNDLPAVVFAPTGLIETGRHFYHVTLSGICRTFTENDWRWVLETCENSEVRAILERHGEVAFRETLALRLDLGCFFMTMDHRKRARLLSLWEKHIEDRSDFPIDHLTWSQLRSLKKRKIDVESHTVNHNKLASLSDQEQREELVESRETLARKLDCTVSAICYPEGSYDEDTLRLSREAGYQIGFSSDDGIVDYPVTGDDRYRLPRSGPGRTGKSGTCYPIGVSILKRLVKLLRERQG